MITLDLTHLESIFHSLTMQTRRPLMKRLWQKRGLVKMQRNRDKFIKYWKNRLEKGNISDIRIYYSIVEKTFGKQSFTPPSILDKATSLSGGLVNWAWNGFNTVSDTELENRKAICESCIYWDSLAFRGTGKCELCGCSTRAKLRMATSSCPDGRW